MLKLKYHFYYLKQDLEVIRQEQSSIEAATGNAYAEPNAIPKIVDGLIADCRNVIQDAKAISKDLERAKAVQSKDVGKILVPIGEKLLYLDRQVLLLAQSIEKLGQRLIKNGEDLVNREKFTPELKMRTDTQGKRLQSIGQKLKNIGLNFGVIGNKFGSIGSRRHGGDGSKLNSYGDQLKILGEQIITQAGSVEKTGIELQKLEPNVRDKETDRDLDDIQNALAAIIRDLEDIIKASLYIQILMLIKVKITGCI